MLHSKLVPASLSLVIPAYNEAEVIGQAIGEAIGALKDVVAQYEIIVVDDGSTDATESIVRSICHGDPHVRLIQHEANQGYGAALRDGFAAATGDLVAFTDADCQFDLAELDRFLLLSKGYDVVCGYRIDRQDTWLRCLYSRVYNWIVRLLLGIRVRDVDCALKVFRKSALSRVALKTDGFLVNSDLLTQIRDSGGSIVEVGVTHRPRAAGETTVSVRHIPKVLGALVRYWWNEVQFPSASMPINRSPSRPEQRRFGWMQWALIAFACLFLFTNLSYPLIDRDETRYAEIAREMLVSGNWVLPTLNFETYYDKPPLLYWSVACSYVVFGIHEWSARFVPAMSSLGTLLLVLWFANRHLGRKTGFLSGGVLMLTAGFAFTSRYLLLDGLLTLLTTASLLTAYEAVTRDAEHGKIKWSWWITASLFCGLGFLTKGPLSIVLLLPPILVFSWLTHDAFKLGWQHVASLLAIVAAVAAPWMIAVSIQDDQFLYEFFVRHNIRRFAGEFHDRPFWYFLPVLLIAGHPWSFLAIPLIRHLTSQRDSVRSQRAPMTGFLVLWVVWMFFFFSASRCKLPTYLLPTAPAFAIIVADYVRRVLAQEGSTDAWDRLAGSWSPRLATATTCFVGVAAVLYATVEQLCGIRSLYNWAAIWGVLIVVAVVLLNDRRHVRFAWVSTIAVTAMLIVMAMHQLVPSYSRLETLFAPGTALELAKDRTSAIPIATVNHEFSEVPYYLNRSDIKNLSIGRAHELSEFAQRHAESLLVVDRRMLIGEIRQCLPPGTRLQFIEDRGPARVLMASSQQEAIARVKLKQRLER